MNFFQAQDTSQVSSLLDAAMGESPTDYLIAQTEEMLRKSGSVWCQTSGSQGQGTIEGAWYAQLGERAYWTLKRYGDAEVFLANWMRARMGGASPISVASKGLTDSQRRAALVCLENQASCLSGLPGTGKTYTCRAIAESFIKAGLSVIGCALTGIAASRLSESAQIEASTIHRLLGWRGPEVGYTVECVPYDCVIVDECSMLDNQLLLSLVSRLSKDCRLVMVGDPNQLPSVEPGDAFRELCSVMPHARLTEILRQEKDSPIGIASEAILRGDMPQSDESSGGGIFLINNESLGIYPSGNSQRRERNHPLTVAERMAEVDGTELRFVRTMCSTNETVDRLNHLFTVYKKVKSEHPVMCIKNNHDLEIYNGDIGYKEWRKYRFGGRVLSLPHYYIRDAWACTVNKLQGQECQSAQLVIEDMVSRRAAYTALTRAKRRFCFTGNMSTLERQIKKPEEKRVTLLAGLIDGSVRYTDTSI